MAARTTLADGTVVRWHADLDECRWAGCRAYHVTLAELFAPDPAADTARLCAEGVAAGKGER